MNTENANFQGEKRTEKKERQYHPTYQMTVFLIRLSPELSQSAVSAASFLMIFFNSVSTSLLCTYSGSVLTSETENTRFAKSETSVVSTSGFGLV